MWLAASGPAVPLLLQVKQEMQAAGFQPSLSIWGSLIVACGRAGLLESAFSFWAEMQARGVRPNTDCLNALMNACADGYQGDRAIALLRDMQAQGVKAPASQGLGFGV